MGGANKAMTYTVLVDGKKYNVQVAEGEAVDIQPAATTSTSAAAPASGEGTPVTAPMPGNIFKLLVSEGESVSEGQTVLIMEAMKMETEIKASVEGTVGKVVVKQGDNVESGQLLLTIYG